MRICIIEADIPSAELSAGHGTFGDMFTQWLGAALPEARFGRVAICNGEEAPPAAAFDGFLVTGSPHGVYDDLPWMARIRALLAQAKEERVPVAGVCFGHQIMADAFGGRVEKASRGWCAGSIDYTLTAAGERRFGSGPLRMLAMHQDQVVEAPPGSRILLGNDDCPIAGLEYDHPALSVQFHPEFEPGFMKRLLELFSGERMPEPLAREALAQLAPAPGKQKAAEAFASFFRRQAPGSR